MKLQEDYKRVSFSYGFLMLRTRAGLALLDKLGSLRITKPLAWLMLYIMPVAAGAAFFLVVGPLSVLLSPQGAALARYIRSVSPLANLLLPGLNPYVPLVYGWIALVIAVVVHEGSHGIVARSLNLPVKSAGVFFFLALPIGAFVEVDDKQLKAAKARDSTRVLAAGSGINFIIAVASLLLLILAVGTMVPASKGVYITSLYIDHPAYQAGLRPGDFVTAVNNVPVSNLTFIRSVYKPGQILNLTISRDGNAVQLSSLRLATCQALDPATNKTFTYACMGVTGALTNADLQARVTNYVSSFSRTPVAYVCPPALPRCQAFVPFSDPFIGLYASSLGPALPVVTNLLFWLYFINFNLAIFNALPIYPMDGGQAFEATVKGLGRGKISDEGARKITTGVTFLVVGMMLTLYVGPYLTAFVGA